MSKQYSDATFFYSGGSFTVTQLEGSKEEVSEFYAKVLRKKRGNKIVLVEANKHCTVVDMSKIVEVYVVESKS